MCLCVHSGQVFLVFDDLAACIIYNELNGNIIIILVIDLTLMVCCDLLEMDYLNTPNPEGECKWL